MTDIVLLEAETRRYGDSILQHKQGIDAAKNRVIQDLGARSGGLASLKSTIEALPETDGGWTAERKASLVADIEKVETYLSDTIQAVYDQLTG